MDTTATFSIVVIALMIVATFWWVLRPLFGNTQQVTATESFERQSFVELELRRDAIYKAIKDLEFDFESNKISEDDYQQARLKFMQQAAGVLRQIDHYSEDVDAELDARIDELLAQLQTAEGKFADEALRQSIRAEIEREAQTTPTETTCPKCGQPVQPGDGFCSACGASLSVTCPNCQAVAVPGDVFCAHCGTRLVTEEVAQ